VTEFRRVLLDTSPLVAIFQPNESNHRQCVDTLRRIEPPLLTTWPVLTEVHYLLRHDRRAQRRVMTLVSSDAVQLITPDTPFFPWYDLFVERYHDHDIQLADASLVWLAEQLDTTTVFTLDRRDFSVFRVHREDATRSFQILPEL